MGSHCPDAATGADGRAARPGTGAPDAHLQPSGNNTPPAAPPAVDREGVLFVDDEAVLTRLWHTVLTRLGYDVTTCTDSEEALRLFRDAPERYDIVVTDQAMPGLTGDALIQELRRLRPDLPVVLCTGFSHTMTSQKAQTLDINVFLMKPMGTDDLVRAIQQALTGAPVHPLS
jgi:CheY-like chemotaxis protein